MGGCATGRGGGHSLKGHSHPVLQLLSVSLKDLCATHQKTLIGFELRAQNNRRLKAIVHLKNVIPSFHPNLFTLLFLTLIQG